VSCWPVLGPAVVLNDAVREAFPALALDWADHSTVVFEDGDRGPGVTLRPGAIVPAGSVLGLFAGTVRVGSPPRGHAVLPLPAAPPGCPGVRLYVDAELRACRHRSAGEAVLYMHACVNPTVVGEWWLGGLVPCLIARAARDLRFPDDLCWDFNEHGGVGWTCFFGRAGRAPRAGPGGPPLDSLHVRIPASLPPRPLHLRLR
jgi:hypothetical protein